MVILLLLALLLIALILLLFWWRLRYDREGRFSLFAVLLSLPWLALTLYLVVGTPEALSPQKSDPPLSLEEAIARLQERLEANPRDLQGWILLARSYRALGRWSEAAESYRKALQLAPEDLDLKARYAETLAAVQGSFEGEPRKLLRKILQEAPDHPYALWLLGLDALNRGERERARELLGRLLRQMPPGAEAAEELRSLMERHGLLAKTEEGGGEIRVKVRLAPHLQDKLPEGAVLLVFARTASGPPLAVVRRPVEAFPVEVTLSDRNAILPGRRLSQADRVVVVARISRSGQAEPEPGDLEGRSGPVKPGGAVEVVIDHPHVTGASGPGAPSSSR